MAFSGSGTSTPLISTAGALTGTATRITGSSMGSSSHTGRRSAPSRCRVRWRVVSWVRRPRLSVAVTWAVSPSIVVSSIVKRSTRSSAASVTWSVRATSSTPSSGSTMCSRTVSVSASRIAWRKLRASVSGERSPTSTCGSTSTRASSAAIPPSSHQRRRRSGAGEGPAAAGVGGTPAAGSSADGLGPDRGRSSAPSHPPAMTRPVAR